MIHDLFVAVPVSAGHDRNGNGRRGWIVLSASGANAVQFVINRHRNDSELYSIYEASSCSIGPTIDITPSAFREWQKWERDRAGAS